MSSEPKSTASPAYAHGRLARALDTAVNADDPQVRARARQKAGRWQAVIAGISSGQLVIGSRTPVADTPAWVTLEVAHGGFATGRFLAETPLDDDESRQVRSLPVGAPGTTDRERLNLWYLGDEGQASLLQALRTEQYRVDVPEESALLIVAWLLDHGHVEEALDLVAGLRPLMHRLRFTPRLAAGAPPSGAVVRLESVATVKAAISRTRTPSVLARMRETLQVWHPLHDRLVALWCDTVDGDLPSLVDVDGTTRVAGGWPCQVWPADWSERRRTWLADADEADRGAGHHATAHPHPKSNFARLREALQACPEDSRSLSARDVGWIRRALANTVTRHGAPGSETRAALRSIQAASVARPTHATLARVLAGRLDRYPADGGLPAVDPIAVDAADGEDAGVPVGTPMPPHLVAKAGRALEAPISELVSKGVITSGEVVARVLPQVTSQLLAAGIADSELATCYAHTYTAFRRRRSLLLLNLEHQVRFDELPWMAVLSRFRAGGNDVARASRQAMRHVVLVTLTGFPQTILPNPLVRELGALATAASLRIPLVEEVAADIFMGTFTAKWRDAARVASDVLAGTLYARYYDLPEPATWSESQRDAAPDRRRWGKRTADDFAALCATRAKEAQSTGRGNWVAGNGTVLEQSQILTTQNLATLVATLDLTGELRHLAPDLIERILDWVVRRQCQPGPHHHAALQMVKNTAYAWRQALFFLSFCDERTQYTAVARLRRQVADAGIEGRFAPAVDGLAHVVAGGRFTGDGTVPATAARRFLGWAAGSHWCVPSRASS